MIHIRKLWERIIGQQLQQERNTSTTNLAFDQNDEKWKLYIFLWDFYRDVYRRKRHTYSFKFKKAYDSTRER